MRVTLYLDYSLRILMYLGRKPDARATISEIADYHNISRNHLIKVVHQLGINGFLHTTRGKHGGIRLARSAGEIGLGDVTRKMDGQSSLLACFSDAAGECRLNAECGVKGAFADAFQAFLERLDHYTLADMLEASPSVRNVVALGNVRTLPLRRSPPARRGANSPCSKGNTE